MKRKILKSTHNCESFLPRCIKRSRIFLPYNAFHSETSLKVWQNRLGKQHLCVYGLCANGCKHNQRYNIFLAHVRAQKSVTTFHRRDSFYSIKFSRLIHRENYHRLEFSHSLFKIFLRASVMALFCFWNFHGF